MGASERRDSKAVHKGNKALTLKEYGRFIVDLILGMLY